MQVKRPYYEKIMKESYSGDIMPILVQKNIVMTVTVMVKNSVRQTPLYLNCPYSFDYSLAFSSTLLGKVVFIPDITASYRLNPNSLIASHKSEIAGPMGEIYMYYVYAFFHHEGYKRNILMRLKILWNIATTNIYSPLRLKDFIKTYPPFAILCPMAFVSSLTSRILHKFFGRQ